MRSSRSLCGVVLAALVATGSGGCAYVGEGITVGERRDTIDVFALDRWRRVAVPGVVITTSLPEETVTRFAREIEVFTRIVDQFVLPEARRELSRPVELTLFGTRAQWDAIAGVGVGGYAATHGNETIIMADGSERDMNRRSLINHELVHAVLFQKEGRAFPRWFHEGLAEMLANVVVIDDVATVGTLPHDRMRNLSQWPKPHLDRFLSSNAMFGAEGYVYAWIFVHYGLFSGHYGGEDRSQAFWEFVDRASRGESWRSAFAASFRTSIDVIEAEWWQHRDRLLVAQLVPKRDLVVDDSQTSLDFVSLDPREVLHHIARVGSYGVSRPTRPVEALNDEILIREPDDVAAHCRQVRYRLGAAQVDQSFDALQQLERLPHSGSDGLEATRHQLAADYRVARYRKLATSERSDVGKRLLAEAREHYREALDLEPESAEAWLRLGQSFEVETDGEAKPGIEAIEHGMSLDRWHSPDAEIALAKLYIRIGDNRRAREILLGIMQSYRGSSHAKDASLLMTRHDLH